MRKTIISILILTVLFVLSGCGKDDRNPSSGQTSFKESYRGRMSGESVTRHLSVYVGEDRLLHMYEPEQKADIVLCNKADCLHEPYDEINNPDPTCDAALNKELFPYCAPMISDRYIYLVGEENLSRGVVYRENLDGSGRTRLFTMDYQVTIGSQIYVEDKIAYAEAAIPIISEDNLGGASTNNRQNLILKINLETGETTELSPLDQQEFQDCRFLDKKGDRIYFEFSYRILGKRDKDYSTAPEYCRVYCYDMQSGKTSQLFSEEELEGVRTAGMTDQALCVQDIKTGEALEISLADKNKNTVYRPGDAEVTYFVFQGRWIIGNMKGEWFYLDRGELVPMPEIVSLWDMMGDYIGFLVQDKHQVVYGDSFFTNNREVIMERNEVLDEG